MDSIHNIFAAVEHYLNLYENRDWLKTANQENIVHVFKIATFVEKAFIKLQDDSNCLQIFMENLHQWIILRMNNRKRYTTSVFLKAPDNILQMFLTSVDVSRNQLKIAIRIYISIWNEVRFKTVLTNTILYSNSCKAIVEYVAANTNGIDVLKLQSNVLLAHWVEQVKLGHSQNVRESIDAMVESDNIESHLSIIFTLVTLTNLDNDRKNLTTYVINKLCDFSKEINSNTTSFWTAFFNDCDRKLVLQLCRTCEEFFNIVLNFLLHIIIASEQRLEGGCSTYPKISVALVNSFLEMLLNDSFLSIKVKLFLEQNHDSIRSRHFEHLKLFSSNSQEY